MEINLFYPGNREVSRVEPCAEAGQLFPFEYWDSTKIKNESHGFDCLTSAYNASMVDWNKVTLEVHVQMGKIICIYIYIYFNSVVIIAIVLFLHCFYFCSYI